MSDLPAPAEVLDKLAAFGSARQIADHLEEQGVVGYVGSATSCPIACYVGRAAGVAIAIGCQTYAYEGVEGETPPTVGWFIDDFDDGHFPQLFQQQ